MKLLRATSPQARSFPPTRLRVLLPFNLLDVTGRGGSRTMNGIMEVGSETHHNSPPFFPCSRWDLRLWITTLGLRQATNDAERVRQSQLLQSRHTAITPSLSYGNSCTAATLIRKAMTDLDFLADLQPNISQPRPLTSWDIAHEISRSHHPTSSNLGTESLRACQACTTTELPGYGAQGPFLQHT